MRSVVLPVCFALVLGGQLFAQTSPYVSVIGTVQKIDTKENVMTVKPDKGDATANVKFDERTTVAVIPAGDTDIKKAKPGAPTDIAPGDKVIARVLTADPTGKPARTIYVTKQADLAKYRERTQEEWKTATNGLISSIEPGKIKINSRVPGSPTPKEISLDLSDRTSYERYNPETGKYEESNLAAIKVGDQLRVLGEKNPDGTEIKAENVGTGSFKTVGVQVKTVDVAAKQIVGTETGSKTPIVISLRDDTTLRKFTDMAAMMVARQLNPTMQQAGGRRGGGGGGGGFGGGAPRGGAAGDAGQGGGRGFGGRGGGRGGMDVGKIIDQQPTFQLSELKPGDPIIVQGANAKEPGKLVAITLVAGVEPILRAAPNSGPDPLAGSWNIGGGGGGDQ